jgi:hypothetical protein
MPGVRVAVLGRKKIRRIFGTFCCFVFLHINMLTWTIFRNVSLAFKSSELPNIICHIFVPDVEICHTYITCITSMIKLHNYKY